MAVKTEGLKLKYSLYSALAFFLVANPVTFPLCELVDSGCRSQRVPYSVWIHASYTCVFRCVVWSNESSSRPRVRMRFFSG